MKKVIILLLGLFIFTQNSFGLRLKNETGFKGGIFNCGSSSYNNCSVQAFYRDDYINIKLESLKTNGKFYIGVGLELDEAVYLFEFKVPHGIVHAESTGYFKVKRILFGYQCKLTIGADQFKARGAKVNY